MEITMVAVAGKLVQTMNMIGAANENRDAFRIAAITGVSKGPAEYHSGLGQRQQGQGLVLTWEDERAILSVPGWNAVSWKQRIDLLQGVLATFECISDRPLAEMLWLFSGKVTRKANASALLGQWIQDCGPPLLDVIDLVAEQHNEGMLIKTVGLSAVVGHEIDALVNRDGDEELARMVGRLAQETLINGPLITVGAIGPDGSEYRFERIAETDSRARTIRILVKNTFKTDSSPRAQKQDVRNWNA
jgi:hypothetical protein